MIEGREGVEALGFNAGQAERLTKPLSGKLKEPVFAAIGFGNSILEVACDIGDQRSAFERDVAHQVDSVLRTAEALVRCPEPAGALLSRLIAPDHGNLGLEVEEHLIVLAEARTSVEADHARQLTTTRACVNQPAGVAVPIDRAAIGEADMHRLLGACKIPFALQLPLARPVGAAISEALIEVLGGHGLAPAPLDKAEYAEAEQQVDDEIADAVSANADHADPEIVHDPAI